MAGGGVHFCGRYGTAREGPIWTWQAVAATLFVTVASPSTVLAGVTGCQIRAGRP